MNLSWIFVPYDDCVCDNAWVNVDYLSNNEFNNYLDSITNDIQAEELRLYTKREAIRILKDEISKYDNFYDFVKNYSPRDYKCVKGKEYVSQRVLNDHVKYWNEIHNDLEIKLLRVFFM